LRSDTILQLGRKIVDELGLDQSVDTLGRWMAHYIAELIQSAEAAQGDDRPEKLSCCANAILDLWKHRSVLPSGKRPFEDFEPILRALESLDLYDDTRRYFRLAQTAAGEDEQHAETKKWLDLGEQIDDSARILIRYCLARAAENAIDNPSCYLLKSMGFFLTVMVKLPISPQEEPAHGRQNCRDVLSV
jgi:hypothetical protein